MSHVPSSRPLSLVPTITPASLQSLCIYNPSFGPTDETLSDQIVFYLSRPTPGTQNVDENEKLRQIGLAQGLVNFAADFAKNPDGCTCVETEKSRIIVLETEESGWWILARIELTFTHNPTKQPPTSEWSSRDVSPPPLLCAQLRRAYSQYRFRYGTFQSNYSQLERSVFCKRLNKYWRKWAFNQWEVLLNKSPAMELLVNDSVKMVGSRSGGEIPDQEKGFLKRWIKKEEARGVIDMVVCRFGEEEEKSTGEETTKGKEMEAGLGSWLWGKGKDSGDAAGKKQYRGPPVIGLNDGCVFQGIGELSTRSVIDMTNYMIDMYENSDLNLAALAKTPTLTNESPRRRRKRPTSTMSRKPSAGTASSTEHSPRNSISITRSSELTRPSSSHTPSAVSEIVEELSSLQPLTEIDPTPEEHTQDEDQPQNDISKPATKSVPATSKVMSYLTFGWSGHSQKPLASTSTPTTSAPISSEPSAPSTPYLNPTTAVGTPANFQQPRGRFIFGFQGDLNIDDLDNDDENSDGKITSRSVWINRSSAPSRSLKECKLVVYTLPPLTFSLFVAPSSPYLTSPSFYRAIHHQLSPLIPRILHSPQPMNLLPTLSSPPSLSSLSSGKSKASKASKKRESKLLELQKKQQEYTLLYDPLHKTVHSTIPPIPEPGRETKEWTRADAMGVWGVVLGMVKTRVREESRNGKTKGRLREKSVRSMKGWWVLWVRGGGGEEGVLVRRAPAVREEENKKGGIGGAGRRGDGRRVLEELMGGGKGKSSE